tara:strand:- start:6886 stop:7071 length:186 start_codon:yes stop_codon:yes gene_type:complete
MNNPYEPPKTDPKREYDRWLESINKQEETDWAGFIFAVVVLAIIFFQPFLIDFFAEIFKKL